MLIKIIWIVVFFVLLIFWIKNLAFFSPTSSNFNIQQLQSLEDRSLLTLKINDQEYKVEVVNESSSIIKGLSGRLIIGSDGMLFVLGQKIKPSFWMKEMKFALDLIWISDNRIVQIDKNVPFPDQNLALALLPRYQSSFFVNQVLEVVDGFTDKQQIEVGDEIDYIF